jgi:pimeloyl-ACP methyl ester carboxylesterase
MAHAHRARPGRDGTAIRFLLGTETTDALIRSTRAAHAALPGSSLRELEGHGHAAMDADPGLFVAAVEEWLGEINGGARS